MDQKGIVFLMVGLLSVSVLGGAALASVVTASTQGGYRNPCVLSGYNPQASTFSNNTVPMGIWTTYTSNNGTVHHECDATGPIVHGNDTGTGIVFTQPPPGYGIACSFIPPNPGCTIFPITDLCLTTPTACSNSTSTTSTVDQNTTQTTTSTP